MEENLAETRNYEGLIWLSPTLSEDDVNRQITEWTTAFPKGSCEVENLGLKQFVYPIKKETRGFHLRCRVAAEVKNWQQMDEKLRTNPVVLRHMFTYAPRPPRPQTKEPKRSE